MSSFNEALIVGKALQLTTLKPANDVLVTLQQIAIDSALGGTLTLYDGKGKQDAHPQTRTNGDGLFALNFLWDAMNLGAVGSDLERDPGRALMPQRIQPNAFDWIELDVSKETAASQLLNLDRHQMQTKACR